jgi:hypothetical protein
VSVLAPVAVPEGARALLGSVVDYAGLFPPTSATMGDAVAHFAEQRAGADQWMLGRFVLPASRLAEFKAVHAPFAGEPAWGLSAVVGDLDAELPGIVAFNSHARGAVVDAMEVKASTVADIERVAAHRLPDVDVYVEVGLADPERLLRVVAVNGFFGKVRTGGVTADGIPSPRALVEFLVAAVRLGLPFKCTAGLHHPLRGDFASPMRATRRGDVRVAERAAGRRPFVPAGRRAASKPCSWSATSRGFVRPQRRRVARPDDRDKALEAARASSVRSFGSCSFRGRRQAGAHRARTVMTDHARSTPALLGRFGPGAGHGLPHPEPPVRRLQPPGRSVAHRGGDR